MTLWVYITNHKIRLSMSQHSCKPFGRYTNDREQLIVDRQRITDHLLIGEEPLASDIGAGAALDEMLDELDDGGAGPAGPAPVRWTDGRCP